MSLAPRNNKVFKFFISRTITVGKKFSGKIPLRKNGYLLFNQILPTILRNNTN